jgi:predicted  nucleic acid-binding Zn-ribbon protein
MAQNKIIGFEIKVGGDEDLKKKMIAVANEIDKVNNELKQAEKAKKQAFGNTAEVEKFNQRIVELKAQKVALKKEDTALNKELKLQVDAFAAVGKAAGSYDALDAKLKLLRAQLKGLSDENR